MHTFLAIDSIGLTCQSYIRLYYLIRVEEDHIPKLLKIVLTIEPKQPSNWVAASYAIFKTTQVWANK